MLIKRASVERTSSPRLPIQGAANSSTAAIQVPKNQRNARSVFRRNVSPLFKGSQLSQVEPKFGGTGTQGASAKRGQQSPVHLRKMSKVVEENAYNSAKNSKYQSAADIAGADGGNGGQEALPSHLHANEEQAEQPVQLGSSAIQQFFNVLDSKGNIVAHKLPQK